MIKYYLYKEANSNNTIRTFKELPEDEVEALDLVLVKVEEIEE